MSLLRYLRLRLCAFFLRLLVRLTWGKIVAHPDEILYIPSRSPGRTIKVHVYKPKSEKQSEKPSPILLNLHGSGYVLPFHGSDDEFCRRMAQEANYTVLDLRYRLAPEHPFPAAIQDVEDGVRWILSQPSKYEPSRLAISGFSAGGGLALAIAGGGIFDKDTFSSVITFYPGTNKYIDPGTRTAPDQVKSWHKPTAVSRFFSECYLPPGIDRKSPLVSPLFAPADSFPRNLLFVTAARDVVCLESEALAAKIDDASGGQRNVVTVRMEGCGHAWDKNAKPGSAKEKAKKEAYALAVNMLKR